MNVNPVFSFLLAVFVLQLRLRRISMRQLLPTKQETFSKQTDNEAHFTQRLARCLEMVGLFPQALFFRLTTSFTLHVYDCMQRCQRQDL